MAHHGVLSEHVPRAGFLNARLEGSLEPCSIGDRYHGKGAMQGMSGLSMQELLPCAVCMCSGMQLSSVPMQKAHVHAYMRTLTRDGYRKRFSSVLLPDPRAPTKNTNASPRPSA